MNNFFESFYHNKDVDGLCNIRILPDTIAGYVSYPLVAHLAAKYRAFKVEEEVLPP